MRSFISSRTKNTGFIIFIFAISFLAALGCTDFGTAPDNSSNDSTGGPMVETVSYANDIRDTLVLFCGQVGCHGGGTVQGGLLMGSLTWNEIINASGNHGPIIVPGDAMSSNLYLKLTPSPPFGERMPQFGPYLPPGFQEKVRDWIDQGALDN